VQQEDQGEDAHQLDNRYDGGLCRAIVDVEDAAGVILER
jgi:hypothetical protein